MGQVCVDNAYRGKGVFSMLYEEQKDYSGANMIL
jgi:hypothetical protein